MRLKCIAAAAALAMALSTPAPAGPRFRLLHAFGGSGDGAVPNGSPVLDSRGNVYGVTNGGPGEYGNGTVYELSPRRNGTRKEKILHSFSGGSDGAYPWGPVIFDGAGNIYGTVQGDGYIATAGVFELTPSPEGWSNTVIYSAYASPGLLIDSAGNLYGGLGVGEYRYGAIAELSPGSSGWSYTALYNFCSQQYCRRLGPTRSSHLGRPRQYVRHHN